MEVDANKPNGMPQALHDVVREMHRRSIWQVLGIYIVGAWVSYEVVLGLTEGLGLPAWVPPMAIVLFVIGLPIVLATAFIQEGLPGQREESSTAVSDGPGGPPGTTATAGALEPTGGTVPRLFTWKGASTGGVLAFALLGLASAGFMAMRGMGIGPMGSLVGKGELAPQDPVLVAEFTPLTGDSTLARVVAEAMRVDLSQSELLNVVDRTRIQGALERMGRTRGATLHPDLAREVAVRLGLKAVVEGEIGQAAGPYLLTASLVTPDSGRVLGSFRETAADSTELLAAVGRLSRQLREKAGESLSSVRASAPLTQVTTSSLPALRKYVAGREAESRGDHVTGMRLMSQAIELDPGFASAHRAMAVVMYNAGSRSDSMFTHARKAVELGDRLTEQERLHAVAFYDVATHDLRGAMDAYETLLTVDSTDHVALINLGHIHDLRSEYEEAERLAKMAAQVGFHGLNTTFWNLNRALYAQGKSDEALRWLARAREEHPDASAPLAAMRWLVEMHRGDYAAAERAVEGEDLPFWKGRSHLTRGQVDDAREIWSQTDRTVGDIGSDLLLGMMRARMDQWILGRRDAVDDLADLVDGMGFDTLDLSDLPVPHVAVILAAGGHPEKAEELVATVRAGLLPELLGQHEGMLLLAEGLAGVDQGRVDEGFRVLERAQQAAICRFCFGAHIGRAYESTGRPDEAIERYTRYLEAPWADRFEMDVSLPATGVWLQAPTHERLARLLEERGEPGDLERAVAHYEALVEMWEEADPELQPRVEQARAALARLQRG